MKEATPEATEKNPQSPKSDFFEDLYGATKPRVIIGGKITREQAAALGIDTDKQ
jgi:hypothetical protein